MLHAACPPPAAVDPLTDPSGLLQTEKAQLEQGLLAQNEAFVPLHWDARDTMNDTAWITHWIQGAPGQKQSEIEAKLT